jgi:hypothetical protein
VRLPGVAAGELIVVELERGRKKVESAPLSVGSTKVQWAKVPPLVVPATLFPAGKAGGYGAKPFLLRVRLAAEPRRCVAAMAPLDAADFASRDEPSTLRLEDAQQAAKAAKKAQGGIVLVGAAVAGLTVRVTCVCLGEAGDDDETTVALEAAEQVR